MKIPRRKVSKIAVSVLAIAASYPLHAQTSVGTDSNTALQTSTAGNITIADEVELEVDGATPLTIDSNNTISIGEDALVIADDANGRSGVVIASGTNGTLTNDGSILVLEDFIPADDDGDGRPDGQIAEATGRTGILVNSTTGTIEITDNGLVSVEGLGARGIAFADGWSGQFDNDGTIYVLGDNSQGISTGDINGDLTVSGAVTAVGSGAQSLVVGGDVDGRLIIDGTLVKSANFTTDAGVTYALSRSALRVAQPNVHITGDVSGGILIDAPPIDTSSSNTDEDGDGVLDSDETTGAISSYGESPAMVIGSASDIVIGSGTTRDGSYSLGIDGSINAYGHYSTFDATGVVIGGQGGTVDMAGGISVGGLLAASTPDSAATALLINQGANVPRLYISGSVMASISSPGEGSAVAVRDLSGTLTQVDNTGFITVSGAAEDETVALDLSHTSADVSIRQYLNELDAEAYADELEDEDYDPSDPTIYAQIRGDILTGSGDDLLDVSTGIIRGDTYLGAGDDRVILSGNAQYIGEITPGSGDFTLTLSDTAQFSGNLDAGGRAMDVSISDDAIFSATTQNAANLAIDLDGGLLQAPDGETVSFGSLDAATGSMIGIVVDSEAGTSSTFVIANANFATGTLVDIDVDQLLGADGTYRVLTSGNLTGAGNLSLATEELPLLYVAQLRTLSNAVEIDLRHKTATELGLTGGAAAAYEPVLALAAEEDYLSASFLALLDTESLTEQIDQLLPAYHGGVLDFVTRSSRLANRRFAEGIGRFRDWPVGLWVEALYFTGSQDDAATADTSHSGYAIAGGWERRFGDLFFGASGHWASGSIDTADYQTTDIGKYEGGLHARIDSGPFQAFARGGYYTVTMDGSNSFTGDVSVVAGEDEDDESTGQFTYTSTAEWSGRGYTGALGASYAFDYNNHLTLRPAVVLDYFQLEEDGYTTESSSDTINLTVASRSSDVLSAMPSLTASYRLGRTRDEEQPLTAELEAGYRTILGGNVGSLVTNFEDGESFTLVPADLQGGWSAEARLLAGGWFHTWQIAVGAQQTGGGIDMSTRLMMNVAF